MIQTGATCKSRYAQLVSLRLTFLDRARECSKLTIPSLIPPEGHSASSKFYTPYQGVGANGVNNLAAKLLQALLPSNSPFFRLLVDEFTLTELSAQDDSKRSVVQEGLAVVERSVQSEIESLNIRSPMFEGFKHLIVGGNVLVYLPDTGLRVFPLDKYVVVRDPYGNILEIIIKEELNRATLEEDILALIQSDAPAIENENKPKVDQSANVELYTRMYRTGKTFKLYQEVEGKIVPGSEATYPIDKAPMIALRWTRIDGEDYGRGHIEEYIGDLITLEQLSRAITQAAAVMAKVVFAVNPNGQTRAADLAQAESGGFITGDPADIKAIQVEKSADLRVPAEQMGVITDRLQKAFLNAGSVQRPGERVTAEEIRYMANELETALGGVYSILAQEFQMPLVSRIMAKMTRQRRLPQLPKGVVKPAIVTGVDALGRGHDLNKFNQLMASIQFLGPEVIGNYLNVGDYLTRVGTAVGIDMKGLVKTQDQLDAEQAQAQQQMQMQQMADLAKPAIGAASKPVAEAAVANYQEG